MLSGCLACDRDDATPVDCQIDSGPCSRPLGGDPLTRVIFDITPKPVVPMKRLRFSVTTMHGGKAIEDADVSASLSMPGMYMMENSIPLKRVSAGRYEGESVIVRCTSGRRVWRADISLRPPGEDRSGPVASFQFRVAP